MTGTPLTRPWPTWPGQFAHKAMHQTAREHVLSHESKETHG